MTTDDLIAALDACAAGIYLLEASVALPISNGTTPMAAIDWDVAITALANGNLPCSGGERRIRQLSASLAAGIPVSLRDTVTGLDSDNADLLLIAIRHATGKRPQEADIESSKPSPPTAAESTIQRH